MLKTKEDINLIFPTIYEGLEVARQGFLKSLLTLEEDETIIRTSAEAQVILEVMEGIVRSQFEFYEEFPALEEIFSKEFGNVREWVNREVFLEIAFLEEFFFPMAQSCPLTLEEGFNEDFVRAYLTTFQVWRETKTIVHQETQTKLKTEFSLKLQTSNLKCQCIACVGDFRAKTREFAFKDLVSRIDETAIKIEQSFEVGAEAMNIADAIAELKKNIEKELHQVRYKLKRSSLSKLDNEIKVIFKERFSHRSEIGQKYINTLKPHLEKWLLDQGLRVDLVGEAEYDRFFMQLDLGLWKPWGILQKEFQRLVQTVMALKRKDISSQILIEYLGQFWVHSEARSLKRKIFYHMGPTNSGKTYHAVEALCKVQKGCYLAPLRLLASELYDTMNSKGVKTTLLTGEEVIEVPDATHTSSTIEMAKLTQYFDCCVIDEIQMMSDPQRGWAWTRALVNIKAAEVHLCGDHSVLDLVKQICELTGDTLEVRKYERKTSLEVMENTVGLGHLQRSDALIVFSRRNALKYKADLENLGYKVSIIYGMLSPEVRREQARKFDQGETDIIVSTDAIAMGMNLPVQRIIFSTFSKFIDNKEYFLSNSEIKQIAGRAGRFGRFPVGKVSSLSKESDGPTILRRAIAADLSQSSRAMVGPDLDIYNKVNNALQVNSLPILSLSEFLRLFNTMTFIKPFYCVDLKEMIELTEMVEQADEKTKSLSSSEIFGFACAPVNLNLLEHVQFYIYILNNFTHNHPIRNEDINVISDNIDYLEGAIKCTELYQWLARHFDKKNFEFNELQLLHNKSLAVERLNTLLSEKIVRSCSSCGCNLPPENQYNICESCFKERRFGNARRGAGPTRGGGRDHRDNRGPKDQPRQQKEAPRALERTQTKSHERNHDRPHEKSHDQKRPAPSSGGPRHDSRPSPHRTSVSRPSPRPEREAQTETSSNSRSETGITDTRTHAQKIADATSKKKTFSAKKKSFK
ncbi:MAG: helicase-related protein [Bacteriovoracaceae bacterium]